MPDLRKDWACTRDLLGNPSGIEEISRGIPSMEENLRHETRFTASSLANTKASKAHKNASEKCTLELPPHKPLADGSSQEKNLRRSQSKGEIMEEGSWSWRCCVSLFNTLFNIYEGVFFLRLEFQQ